MPSSTPAIGSRSTASAATAAAVSWWWPGRTDRERARRTRDRGGLRRRAPELSLALRAAAGAVVRGIPHRDDAPGDGEPPAGGPAPRAVLRRRLLARLHPAGRQRHRARPRAQLLPGVAPADRRSADHRLRAGLSGPLHAGVADPGAPAAAGAQAGRVPG